MPYKIDGDILFWWFDALIIDGEAERYPWLQKPHTVQDGSTGTAHSTQRVRIESPTFTGDFCFACRYINFEWLATGYNEADKLLIGSHEFSGANIRIQCMSISRAKRGSRAGCPSCSILLQILCKSLDVHDIPSSSVYTDTIRSTKSLWSLRRTNWPCRIRSYIGIGPPETPSGSFVPCLSTRIGRRVEFGDPGQCIALRVISDRVDDPRVRHNNGVMKVVPGGACTHADLSRVRSLIDQCISGAGKHERSNSKDTIKVDNSRSLPTYFIDLERSCLLASKTNELEYVALSYVWGFVASVELTTNTLTELLCPGSLPYDSPHIPLTIRDAMLVCHKLGFRHLWVDRLCIIQDLETKNHLIANMHMIFASAALTIVAAAGKDADGVLPGVGPGSRPLCQLTAVSSSAISFAAEIQWGSHAPTWDTRAWTMQEKYCSPRLLYFSSDQLGFECPHFVCNEEDILNSYTGLPKSLFSQDGFYNYCLRVESYSKRHLSYDNNVYNAFAGILAVLSHDMQNPTFISAMPAAYLDYALLFEFGEGTARRLPYSALKKSTWPSWSWLGWKSAAVSHERVRYDQLPCFRWIPDQETMHYVADMFLVQPNESVTVDDLSFGSLGRGGRLERIRHGSHTSAFHSVMLDQLRLRADIALLHVGREDPTEEKRFEILDQYYRACGIIHLSSRLHQDAYRFVKIALARRGASPLKYRGPRALAGYDKETYRPQKIKAKRAGKDDIEVIYKVLAIDKNNERVGCGAIHIVAFDAHCEKDVGIVLI